MTRFLRCFPQDFLAVAPYADNLHVSQHSAYAYSNSTRGRRDIISSCITHGKNLTFQKDRESLN